MSHRLLAVLLVAPAVGLVMVESPPPVRGCAPAPPRGGHVDIASETAVIVWDEATKTQHFIRTASFASTSAEFGFLVPTPTVPELSEASADGFGYLDRATAPRTVVEYRDPEFGCGMKRVTMSEGVAAPNAAPDSVQVLARQRVGAFDAAVLKADDPKALREWLLKNDYDARPELEGWLKAYTANKWIVTAFKVAADVMGKPAADGKPALSITGSAVRMSFRTDTPFFPYREPEDQRATARPRSLRVFLLADARFDGKLGDGSSRWPGRTMWANHLDKGTFEAVARAGKLPDGLAGRDWWLTEFIDESSPRPGTDEVYFSRSPDQSTLERPPNVVTKYRTWPAWVGIVAVVGTTVVLVALLGLVTWRLMRRP
jgi:hypothetical protein